MFILLLANLVMATSLKVSRRDMKLATQQLIEKQTITDAEVGDADQMLAAQATSDSVVTTVTSFLAQPDVCRNVVVTPGGTTADVPAGDITVIGTNFFNESITETLTLTANQSTAATGSKGFKTITSVAFPIQDGASATYNVGTGDKLCLKRCMANAGNLVFTTFDGAYETTRATVAANATDIESNTIDIDGTLNGAKDIEVFFIQNFRCLP